MRFTAGPWIALLASVTVAGCTSGSTSDTKPLIREPQATSPFRVYDPPLDLSQHVSQREVDSTSDKNRVNVALAYLQRKHGIPAKHIRVTSSYTNPDTGVSHVYARQTAGGVDVLNGVANVNINNNGRVQSASQTFAPMRQVRNAMRSARGRLTARTDQHASLKKALKTLCNHIGSDMDDDAIDTVSISEASSDEAWAPKFIIKGIPTKTAVDGSATAQQAMVRGSDGRLVHVWDFMLEQDDYSWNARISMSTEEVESLRDRRLRSGNCERGNRATKDGIEDHKPAKRSDGGALEKRLSYLVVPITRQDPRDGFDFVVNPETRASPNGWVATDKTSGNNAVAYRSSQSNVAEETSPDTFAYYHEDTESPGTPQNVGAAITNAFYVVNSLHDIFYIYGFTEATFNFQDDNYGKGGVGDDRVAISVQDSHDFNGVDFTTPPDGESAFLRLFLFDRTNPDRDSGLENSLIAHAYTLGVANRLTGGGTAACLQSSISKGLAEGWGDAFADWLGQTAAVGDFTIGSYVSNNPGGLRSHPYSRDSSVNPLTYADGSPSAAAGAIGEAWANMLHNLIAGLADNRGWSQTSLTDQTGSSGNVVFMHLFMDGLSIQPCEPTFITARDAIIQADQNRYNGDHFCIIWRVFASKGLGFGAAEDNVNEYSVPPGC